ncbi:hypothetical protein L6164_025285 [Bauhinia variegata]|uniref:Uncharacterized protein n=1 Tax=Bauhinia variegata TaxID=167791 RepID=A0ACB9M2P1_BAUVA|nr:hypothetical protein L6164_025285 [Bauhinia variegata]
MDRSSEKRSLFFISFSYFLFFTNPFGSFADSSSQDSLSPEDEVYFTYSVNRSSLYLGPIQLVPSLTITPWGEIHKALDQSVVSCFSMTHGVYDYFNVFDWDDGCVTPECRRTNGNGNFESEQGVLSTKGFKFEDSENLTLQDCAAKCWYNCSCLAYASTNDTYGTGCEIWTEVSSFNETDENLVARNIYFYRNKSYQEPETQAKIKWWISLVVIGVLIALPIFCYVCYVIWKRCKAEVERIIKRTMLIREIGGRTVVSFLYDIANTRSKAHKTDNEIQTFSFRSIVAATKKFSRENKLGEGGFGSVYKGTLKDGREIAIKRLSKRSGQGLLEFKNEAILIAKLQHTSLVKLLGFCVEREERILVYEYMSNKSLDFYLFDFEKKKILNWSCRFNIIQGIAQGLVYLHMYSRIFELKGIEENTNRIVGTYGYMSPEYAMNGIVSIKTDVFSFGVLVLEIVSGKKNNSRYHSDYPLNLIGLAWQLWRDDKAMEIIDPSLLECCPSHEALRCVQVGLLCVQDRAADRPSMLEVVSMLSNETASLPTPKQPAFYIDVEESESNGSEEKPKTCSINEVTISVMDAR